MSLEKGTKDTADTLADSRRIRPSKKTAGFIFFLLIAVAVAALNAHHLFRRPSQTLAAKSTDGYVLGVSKLQEPFETKNVVTIEQGETSTALLTKEGAIYTEGHNDFGQLGTGGFGGERTSLEKVMVPNRPDIRFKKLELAHRHVLALADNGDVYAWGMNLSGQIGNNTRKDADKPVRVFSGATDIAAGYRFSTALRQDGSLWAWGMHCDPSTPGLEKLAAEFAQDISVGGSYYDGRAQSDDVYCLEENNLPIASITPRRIESKQHFTTVSAGYGSILLLDDDQKAWGYGCNAWGQLGRGHFRNDGGTRQIRPIAFPENIRIKQLDAGFRQGIALDTSGGVWSWGHDERGDPVTYKSNRTDRPELIKSTPADVSLVRAGHDQSGVVAGGAFFAFGDNQQSQISRRAGEERQYVLQDFTRTDDNAIGITGISLGYVRNIYWSAKQ